MFSEFLTRQRGYFAAARTSVSARYLPPTLIPPEYDDAALAYDLYLIKDADPTQASTIGCCFGLPPGITPEQWPLDPCSGFPLQHGFTLKLPKKFRVHGPDIVGLSFFCVAFTHAEGMPYNTEGLYDLITSPADEPPADPELRPFWDHARQAHPRLHRFKDVVYCEYAVILLTEDEFAGAPCDIPEIANTPRLANELRPGWLSVGSAAELVGLEEGQTPPENLKNEYPCRAIGGIPECTPSYRVPIVAFPRQGDPNCGKAPTDEPDGDYELPYDSSYNMKPWAQGLGLVHLGGTMFPVQAMPQMGPWYIELEEYFGGFNFGTGNAQLDLATFNFDWACG